MNELFQLCEKAGLGIAVLLLINLQVLPELRAIRKELLALTFLLARTHNIDIDSALDAARHDDKHRRDSHS